VDVLATLIAQRSRLSAVRLALSHTVAEVLGLDGFNEDDLYRPINTIQINPLLKVDSIRPLDDDRFSSDLSALNAEFQVYIRRYQWPKERLNFVLGMKDTIIDQAPAMKMDVNSLTEAENGDHRFLEEFPIVFPVIRKLMHRIQDELTIIMPKSNR